MTADDLVLLDRPFAGCAVVTLNRPAAMNALSMALRRRLTAVLVALGAEADVRVIVLAGAGRAFCAGLDLKELGQSSTNDLAALLVADEGADPVRALLQLAQPVIGAVNGAAVTGGLELALACDVLIASTEARFADTHARIGVMPGWGLSQRLPRLVGEKRAKELSLTGRFFTAEEAERWGVVSRVVAPSALLDTALAAAREMLTAAPGMLAAYKRVIDDGLALPLGAALQLEAERCAAWARQVRAEAIEARRGPLVERGRRAQSAGGEPGDAA